jgi:hypothetical protein
METASNLLTKQLLGKEKAGYPDQLCPLVDDWWLAKKLRKSKGKNMAPWPDLYPLGRTVVLMTPELLHIHYLNTVNSRC